MKLSSFVVLFCNYESVWTRESLQESLTIPRVILHRTNQAGRMVRFLPVLYLGMTLANQTSGGDGGGGRGHAYHPSMRERKQRKMDGASYLCRPESKKKRPLGSCFAGRTRGLLGAARRRGRGGTSPRRRNLADRVRRRCGWEVEDVRGGEEEHHTPWRALSATCHGGCIFFWPQRQHPAGEPLRQGSEASVVACV